MRIKKKFHFLNYQIGVSSLLISQAPAIEFELRDFGEMIESEKCEHFKHEDGLVGPRTSDKIEKMERLRLLPSGENG